MKTSPLIVGAAAVLVTLFAEPPRTAIAQQVASKDPKEVKAGYYKVETYHTQVTFSLSHFGFSDFSGQFAGASGSLELNPANASSAKVSLTLPVKSLLTTVPSLTEELKGARWLDATNFPDATFVSTKVTPGGNDFATVAGNFTLHGITKPITFRARLIGSGNNPLDKSFTVGFQAVGSIKRSDYGIKQYLPLVGDDVALKIDAAFVLQH